MAQVPEGVVPSGLIDAIGVLESIKAAAAAAQARLSVAFDVAERERQAQLGVPAHRRGRGVAEQIASGSAGVSDPGLTSSGVGEGADPGDATHLEGFRVR